MLCREIYTNQLLLAESRVDHCLNVVGVMGQVNVREVSLVALNM